MEAAQSKFHHQFDDALKSGDMFALYEHAREAIRAYPDDPRARYLQTLAMARLGEPVAALEYYERNRVAEIGSEDAVALRGRLLKDLAVRSSGAERVDMFRQSSSAYRKAYELSDGYFSGINAATTSFLAGDRQEASELASAIGRRPDIAEPQDYYAAASGAEAMLVRGEVERATSLFAEARRRPDASPGMVASTARQVALIAGELSISDEQCRALLASIQPTPVIHFCGHMFRAGWEEEAEIARAVRAILDEADVLIAYGPLACGADIVIAEEILARGGELHVVLPFAEDDFIRTSVIVGGEQWLPRYEAAKRAASSVTLATQMRNVNDDQQFAYCSKLVMGLAQLRASIMQAKTFQLAVWDGVTSGGVAGTAADYDLWAQQGGTTQIVPVPRNRPPLDYAPVEVDEGRPSWSLHSLLFADFAGFSRLDEDRLSTFLEVVMGRIAKVLDRHGEAVLTRNSWGDAVFAVISSPSQAAHIALEIQAELDPDLLTEIGLPPEGGMRISLHHGPIFQHFDAIKASKTYYGTEVTVAARIEPRVPVGSIYTTQPFAAMIESDRNNYHFEYVGMMDLAKNYGVRILYRLGTGDE
ncbi:TRAFs-binding domain-containing protein [Sphingomonas sp. RB56-2]|uniref:TRAFs-binding domain-containing protein n=1 Tax=Sphingomonas brevis TaxID=2908206 RepID=A0ABT0S9G4_9SPHN|nr:adenylate/guanylate cyclase domain-containing protein [Sphingomonas brevis]MCL6741055.1 TRAFs-binding domain-containing protein [Sphingomonas brevis]